MAKKKQGRSQKRRSEKKVLDAFHLAERAQNRSEDSDSDNDELQVRDGIMDARKFVKNQGQVDDDFDDEELDSDEVLNSDDDYDVLNSKFSRSIRDQRTDKNAQDSDNESNYDSIDESQLVTLSEAWDLDDKLSSKMSKTRQGDPKALDVVLDDNWESESSQSQEEQEENESDDESDYSECSESEDEEKMLRGSDNDDDNDTLDMSNTLSTIKAHLKTEPERKRLISETVKESEFGIPSGAAKLSLAEMLGTTGSSEAALISRDAVDSAALPVPLPKRIQERNDRKVAYEITKEEVSKWEETVRAIRNADQLHFPIAPPAIEEQEEVDADRQIDSLQMVPESNSQSELQSRINQVLRAGALLDESKEATFERIAAARLSKEEVFKRTQELRKMRELMFRDEQRARRIKKIKSKQFRKIRKRESLRDAALVEGSDAESDEENHDRKRAEERMSLRHKTHSKWAKSIIKSGITKDASTRVELEEMLRSGERLRSKQLGYQDGQGSDDGVSDIERDYNNDDEELDQEEKGKLGKGVLAMDFMKAAEERKRKENLKEIEFLKNMRENNGAEEFFNKLGNSINENKNQGRRVYTPSAAVAREEAEEAEDEVLHDFRDDEVRSLEKQMRGKERVSDIQSDDEPPLKKYKVVEEEFSRPHNSDEETQASSSIEYSKSKSFENGNSINPLSSLSKENSDTEDNPWLTALGNPAEKSRKYVAISEESSRLSKATNKIKKTAAKIVAKGKATETIVDLSQAMTIARKVHNSEDESEDDGETRMFLQKNLILEAFAGDNVVSEFQEEKRKVVEEEDDKTEDSTLPGWGGWAGADMTAVPKKKFTRKIDGVVQKEKRRDKGLNNVIVNETLNKHNLRYQSSSVPYPYESKEQYERALRMPLGEEWTSNATHKKATQPRIVVKPGLVVDPLKAPFK